MKNNLIANFVISLLLTFLVQTSLMDVTAQTKRRKVKTSTQAQLSKDENLVLEITKDWSFVGSSNNQIVYAKRNTFTSKNNIVEGWFLLIIKPPFAKNRAENKPKNWVYARQLYAFDCEKNKIMADTRYDYDILGKTIPPREGIRNVYFEPIVSNTIESTMSKYTCQIE